MTVSAISSGVEDIIELALPDGNMPLEDDTDLFTSKLGGRPLWLPAPAPDTCDRLTETVASLNCRKCATPLMLLLQMDCPREERSGVDRIAYVFVCNTRICSQDPAGWRILFVSRTGQQTEAPKPTTPAVSFWDSLVAEDCTTEKPTANDATPIQEQEAFLPVSLPWTHPVFPPIYLHIEEELVMPVKRGGTASSSKAGSLSAHLLQSAGEVDPEWAGEQYEKFRAPGTDRSFVHFQKRVAHYPRQCVRYAVCGGQQPLLFTDCELETAMQQFDACPGCNRPRRHFELQLMPAILSFLPTETDRFLQHIEKTKRATSPIVCDGMEWGTVLIYSCGPNGCIASGDYAIVEGIPLVQIEQQ